MPLIERLPIVAYAACVDLELRLAALLGVTYRDVNAGLFFVLWPATTLALVGVVLWQRVMLRRLGASTRGRSVRRRIRPSARSTGGR